MDDGSELFGNWTFGGKHAASLNEVLSNGPWRDGFEVLATMDTNIDGVISETELASLQVWSDENSNAVTDPGELENASDFGLSEIKLQVPRTSPYSRDLISSKAASLVRNDTHRQATLVDWFTPSFFTSMEAISNQPLFRSGPIHSGPIQKDTERVQLNYGASPPTLSDSIGAPDISGIWSWQVQGTDSQDRNSRGFFWIAQNSTAIHGFSIGEIPVVSKSQQTFGSFASPAFLFGVIGSKAFEPQIDFMVSTNDSFLFSEASFDATSGTLHGTTQTTSNANLGAGSIQYSWTAQRVSPTN